MSTRWLGRRAPSRAHSTTLPSTPEFRRPAPRRRRRPRGNSSSAHPEADASRQATTDRAIASTRRFYGDARVRAAGAAPSAPTTPRGARYALSGGARRDVRRVAAADGRARPAHVLDRAAGRGFTARALARASRRRPARRARRRRMRRAPPRNPARRARRARCSAARLARMLRSARARRSRRARAHARPSRRVDGESGVGSSAAMAASIVDRTCTRSATAKQRGERRPGRPHPRASGSAKDARARPWCSSPRAGSRRALGARGRRTRAGCAQPERLASSTRMRPS